MIEEEFDLKHLDIITRELEKRLNGYSKRVWGDDGPTEYIFEDWYDPEWKQPIYLFTLVVSILPDKERVKLAIVKTQREERRWDE